MTPEVAALLHKARESQQAAILLDGANFREFAAARAYYAMFYAAQALLLERGLTFSSHAAVMLRLAVNLRKPICSIRNTIAIYSTRKTCAMSAIMALSGRSVLRKFKRSSHGRMNSFRLPNAS